MTLPLSAWTLDNSFYCLRSWTPTEWLAFAVLNEQMQIFGEVGGLLPAVIELASSVPTFPFNWGTNLIYPGQQPGSNIFLNIQNGQRVCDHRLQLADNGVDASQIPEILGITLQKQTLDGPWGQLLACNLADTEIRIIGLDTNTIFYPYLGPSNFAHELGHAYTKSGDEEFPRICEEAVLLGALELETEENKVLVKILLDQLHRRMGKL